MYLPALSATLRLCPFAIAAADHTGGAAGKSSGDCRQQEGTQRTSACCGTVVSSVP